MTLSLQLRNAETATMTNMVFAGPFRPGVLIVADKVSSVEAGRHFLEVVNGWSRC